MARDTRRSDPVRSLRADDWIDPKRRPLDPEGVHRVRRRIKHVRAVLKLADDAGVTGANDVRGALGAVAKQIAPMRDAAVVVRQAAKWVQKPECPYPEIAAALTETTAPRQPASWWKSWWKSLERAGRELRQVADRASTDTLRRALERSVRRAGKRRRHARITDVERMHRWRKSVIALREQIDFLRPVLAAKAGQAYTCLDDLGKQLGHVTDDEVLIEAAQKRAWSGADAKTAKKFVKYLERHQRRAARRACRQWHEIAKQLKRVCD